MASPDQVNLLSTQFNRLKQQDLSTAFHQELGNASIYDQIAPKLMGLLGRESRIIDTAPDVDGETVQNMASVLQQLNDQLDAVRMASLENFASQRTNYISAFTQLTDAATRYETPFLVRAQDKVMTGSDGATSESINRVVDEIRRRGEEEIKRAREDAVKILAEAVEQSKDVRGVARETAQGISLVTAQNMFTELTDRFWRGILISGGVASAAFIGLFIYLIILILHDPGELNYAKAVYSTAVRVAFIGCMALLISVSLKVFRANLNMYYHTLHRKQLTNSMQTFVDAARTDEQKDLILTKLTEAVASFGNSGLVDGGDDTATAKLIVEALPRILSSKPT